MKFTDYITKKMTDSVIVDCLERIIHSLVRIAEAQEIIAGIAKPKSSLDELNIEVVNVTEEQVYEEEKLEARKSAAEKMEANKLKSPWAEDNLSTDDLESIE